MQKRELSGKCGSQDKPALPWDAGCAKGRLNPTGHNASYHLRVLQQVCGKVKLQGEFILVLTVLKEDAFSLFSSGFSSAKLYTFYGQKPDFSQGYPVLLSKTVSDATLSLPVTLLDWWCGSELYPHFLP